MDLAEERQECYGCERPAQGYRLKALHRHENGAVEVHLFAYCRACYQEVRETRRRGLLGLTTLESEE